MGNLSPKNCCLFQHPIQTYANYLKTDTYILQNEIFAINIQPILTIDSSFQNFKIDKSYLSPKRAESEEVSFVHEANSSIKIIQKASEDRKSFQLNKLAEGPNMLNMNQDIQKTVYNSQQSYSNLLKNSSCSIIQNITLQNQISQEENFKKQVQELFQQISSRALLPLLSRQSQFRKDSSRMVSTTLNPSINQDKQIGSKLNNKLQSQSMEPRKSIEDKINWVPLSYNKLASNQNN